MTGIDRAQEVIDDWHYGRSNRDPYDDLGTLVSEIARLRDAVEERDQRIAELEREISECNVVAERMRALAAEQRVAELTRERVAERARADKLQAERDESDHVLQATGRKLELIRGERDAALAALERVRALCDKFETETGAGPLAVSGCFVADMFRAAAALPEPTEDTPQ